MIYSTEDVRKVSKKYQTGNTSKKEMSFGEVLELWLESNSFHLKKGTLTKYRNLVDTHIKPELGMASIIELDTAAVNNFLARKLSSGKLDGTGGLAPSYVRSMLLIIRASIKYAVDEELCEPVKPPVCKLSIPKRDCRILSLEEQASLENGMEKLREPACIGIYIALYTGLRLGEVCALSWEDIDLSRRTIKVRHTIARIHTDSMSSHSSTINIIDEPKTETSLREIPISSKLYPLLLKFKKYSERGFLLTGKNEFMKPRTFEYKYHRILKLCGMESINFHALRHTFATRCIEAGVDIKSLSEILGHSSVGITLNTYVHSSMEMKRKQLEKLSELLS